MSPILLILREGIVKVVEHDIITVNYNIRSIDTFRIFLHIKDHVQFSKAQVRNFIEFELLNILHVKISFFVCVYLKLKYVTLRLFEIHSPNVFDTIKN